MSFMRIYTDMLFQHPHSNRHGIVCSQRLSRLSSILRNEWIVVCVLFSYHPFHYFEIDSLDLCATANARPADCNSLLDNINFIAEMINLFV